MSVLNQWLIRSVSYTHLDVYKRQESELQLTKEMLINTTLLAQDRQNTLIEREYLKTMLGKKVLSLEEWLESINKVSKEEIIETAKTINLQSVYFMEGK